MSRRSRLKRPRCRKTPPASAARTAGCGGRTGTGIHGKGDDSHAKGADADIEPDGDVDMDPGDEVDLDW
ncbi:hypothetical protein [Streptomyces sp. NPDC057686]|uniref:hypothetical protein n=1 Tax=Streptomyces sp. NPDC057686 TaxID=3346212 RepID=UPI0036BA3DD8